MSRKKHTAGRILILFVIIILIAVCCVYAAVSGKLSLIKRVGNEARIDPSEETFESGTDAPAGEIVDPDTAEDIIDPSEIELMTDSDIVNILLIGCDAADEAGKDRSDSIIICSLNRKDDSIRLISLLRDMYVTIPGYSSNRINAAYMFGGMSLLDETIEENFGVHIDGNVAVDFDAFTEAVSMIGPVEMELTKEEAEFINTWYEIKDNPANLKEGMNVLNPEQTLTYARIRYVGRSDWERTERQRRVIEKVFEKVKDRKLSEILDIADSILPSLSTDMDNLTILNLVRLVYFGKMRITDTFRIPADGTWRYATVSGMSVILPDMNRNSKELQQYIYGSSE